MTELVPQIFFDINSIKHNIEREFNLALLQGYAETLQVTCEDTAKNALSTALQARKLGIALDKSKSEITKPHFDYQKAINQLVKDFKEKLVDIENSLHRKIDGWRKSVKENPFIRVDEIRVEDGQLYTQKLWNYEIEDDSLVPDKFKSIDDKKITKAIDNGIINIPGIRVYQQEKTVLRVKN
jgi:hypothetical protein